MVKNKTNKGNANCNQAILDHFWNISDPSEEKRCHSTQVILQTLASQTNNASIDVAYCIDRLIRGLLSTRDFARHGFCVLLTAILEQFPEHTNLTEAFELAQKEYGSKVAEDSTESTISWTLFLSCVIKSGRITLDTDGDLINQLFDYLFRLGSKKIYVEIIICNLLPHFFNIFAEKPKVFKKTILPLWEAQEDKKSLFYAYFILMARKNFPKRSSDCFNAFFNSSIYQFGSNDFKKVLSLLKETTAYSPNVHPINELLVTTLFEIEPENFSNLCTAIVDDIFKVNWEKSSLGFEMTRILLKFTTPEQVELVLSPKFMRFFIQTLGSKKHPLHTNAVVLGTKLVQLVADKRDDSDYQVAFAKCFINKPGSINFDELSKSKVLFSILKNFGNDSIRAWILLLKSLMTNQEEVPASDFFRIRCLQQICQLIKSYTANDQFLWAISKFLFVYAYFDVSNCKKDIIVDESANLERFVSPISEKLQKQFPDSFKSTFAHLCQVASSGVSSQKEKLQEQTQCLTLMGDFIVGILSKKKVKLLSSTEKPLKDDDIKQTIEDLRSKIEQIDSLKKQNTESSIFKLLHLYFVIELFESYEEIRAILPDFNECANRSLFVDKKTKKSRSPHEPLWADVLTDLLLSLLATKSKYTKSVIVSAFRHLAPFISAVGLQSLTEAVLNKDAFKTDDSDDEEIDEEEVNESKAEKDHDDDDDEEVEEEVEESEESDEDLVDGDDGACVDEQFKLDVIKALGSAVENDEDSDDDAVSDSEMFKVDDSLAEVFRKKFGDKKRANEQQNLIQTFKFRVLELIQIVVEQKQDLSLNLTLELLSSVLLVAKSHYAIKNLAYITNKCINIFEKLTSKKRFEEQEEGVDEEVCRNVLNQLVEMQHKCGHSELQKKLISLFCWLIAVTTKGGLSSGQMFSSAITQSLRDFFERPNVEIKMELFIRTIPLLCEAEGFLKSGYYDALLEYAFNPEIRSFKRCSALEILASLVKTCADEGKTRSIVTQLTTRCITLLIDELNNLANKKQAVNGNTKNSSPAPSKKTKLQYINLLMKLAISCKVFESENSNNAALLKQVGQKLSSTPKDCKKNLNKQFVQKVKAIPV